jgi:hypothetical protein
LVIFGGLFVSLNKQNQNSFTLLQQVFMAIFTAFNKITNETSEKDKDKDKDKDKFLKIFLEYFPNAQKIIDPNKNNQLGGYKNPYPYYQKPYYSKPYNPYYANPYYSNPYQNQYPIRYPNNAYAYNKNNETQICYIIDVIMMLKKGTEITSNDVSNLVCDRRWNAINKSFSALFGRKYEMTADYNNLSSKFNPKKKGGNKKTLKSNQSKGAKTLKRYCKNI